MNYLKNNIKFLRKKHGVNQDAIALRVNKGQSTIGNWENGVSEPNVSELIILSELFKVNIDELITIDLNNTNLSVVNEDAALYEKSNPIDKASNNNIDILMTEKQKLTRQNKSGDKVKIALIEVVYKLMEDVEKLKILNSNNTL